MRRLRRLDLTRDSDGRLHVEAAFRDSHLDDDAVERVVHEYSLTATIDASNLEVLACTARPRVLPYPECPVAAGSTLALHGVEVGDVRSTVRRHFRGPSTCTHLSDLAAMLGDVRSMLAWLP